jgi:hypothetical protein
MGTDLSRWEPASVEEVAAAFARHPGPWWVAGGVAIELAVGRRIRDHADIDIGVLRTDHVAAHEVLLGWEPTGATDQRGEHVRDVILQVRSMTSTDVAGKPYESQTEKSTRPNLCIAGL